MPPRRLPRVSVEELVYLHTVAIGEFGGVEGMRSRGQLESALEQPLVTYGRGQLYWNPFEEAAALMQTLLHDHCFVDGNERVAVMAAALWLHRAGYRLNATHDEIVDTVLDVIERRVDLEDLAAWFRNHIHPR